MRERKRIAVQAILEWAFRVEHASLSLPEEFEEQLGRGYGVNSLLRFERLERLGCMIQGGGKSLPHDDAETVAAIVSNMPDDLGGTRSAVLVAEHARALLSPDWMPDAMPRIVPVAWRGANQNGQLAATEKVGVYLEEKLVPHPRNRLRKIRRVKRHEIFCCPITYDPHPQKVRAAREGYSHWRECLADIRDRLHACGMLRDYEVTDQLPPAEPWATRVAQGRQGSA